MLKFHVIILDTNINAFHGGDQNSSFQDIIRLVYSNAKMRILFTLIVRRYSLTVFKSTLARNFLLSCESIHFLKQTDSETYQGQDSYKTRSNLKQSLALNTVYILLHLYCSIAEKTRNQNVILDSLYEY